MESPPHHVAYLVWSVDCLDLLGPALVLLCRAEVWADGKPVKPVAAKEYQNRDVVRERLREASHCVFGACLGLHGDDAEALSVTDAAIAIGGHHRAAFMAKGDRSDADLGDRRNQRIAWKAGDPFDTFLLQDLSDVVDPVHGASPWPQRCWQSGQPFAPV